MSSVMNLISGHTFFSNKKVRKKSEIFTDSDDKKINITSCFVQRVVDRAKVSTGRSD